MTIHVEGIVDADGQRAVEGLIVEELCKSVTYLQSTKSTNTRALQDLQRGSVRDDQFPRLYLADNQTAGRGRHGRSWLSPAGGLTFSLAVDRPVSDHAVRLLSLAVGVGVACSVEHEFSPLRTALKWPNDVYVHGGKLAGILIETSSLAPQRVVIGVGLNINSAPELDGHLEQTESRSLSQVVGRPLHRYDVLGPLVIGITQSLNDLHGSANDVINSFRDRCLLSGRAITFQDGPARRDGICRGITDTGELIVESDRGTQHVHSGEARLVRTKSQ